MGISNVTNLTRKVTICGGKRFNRFNVQVISNNNGKRMTKFATYFVELQQKITSIKTIESCHFSV